jgi:thiamine kinase-like enzyme
MSSFEDKIRKLPCWNGSITIAQLAGGLSNVNFTVQDADGSHVVRIGKDYPFHHVFREREAMVARAAHAAGFGPRVEYVEAGVMVVERLEAKTLDAADVKARAAKIGTLLRLFHKAMPQHVSGAGFMFWVFHVIRDYVATLRDAQSHDDALLDGFLRDAAALEMVQMALPIVFGHHDLLPANFLDDGKKLWLIDYEYAGFGTAMFDLAGVSSNALMTADESNVLLRSYFGEKPDAVVLQSFAAMECASLLRETLWAMVSGLYLAAPGVDYGAYTTENLQRYVAALDRYQMTYGKLHA